MKKFKRCIKSSRMKKNISTKIKRRRIHTKISKIGYPLKDIPQILSPHNTTQYLIENNSSPFFIDEDDEENFDLDLHLNPFLSLDSGNTFLSCIIQETQDLKDSHAENELASTAAQSQEFQNFKTFVE